MRSLMLAAGVWTVSALALVGLAPSADPCLLPAFRLPAPQASYLRAFQRLSASPRRTDRYDALIREQARRRGVDPRLLKAVIAAESGFEPRARSPRGARGLMQVMPATAAELGIRGSLEDPRVNITAGASYLALLRRAARLRFHINSAAPEPRWLQARVIAAYNAGPRALSGTGWCRQTRLYVEKVQFFYRTDLATIRAPETAVTASAR